MCAGDVGEEKTVQFDADVCKAFGSGWLCQVVPAMHAMRLPRPHCQSPPIDHSKTQLHIPDLNCFPGNALLAGRVGGIADGELPAPR